MARGEEIEDDEAAGEGHEQLLHGGRTDVLAAQVEIRVAAVEAAVADPDQPQVVAGFGEIREGFFQQRQIAIGGFLFDADRPDLHVRLGGE